MRVATFNREAIIGAVARQRRAEGGQDRYGVLDPGFEDSGFRVVDVEVAPGLLGHFATLDEPPPNYFALPTFERTGEAA